MKKLFLVLTVVVITAVGCTPSPTHSTPEAVVNAAMDAWNAGDIEALKALFADDAVACLPDWGDECTTGAEEIGAWIEELVAANFVIEPESTEVKGDTVTVVAKIWADPTRELGVAPLVTTDVYTVQDGQITSQTSTLTEESAASLQAAMASRPSAVVMAYVEAINAGDLEAAMTLCHEEVCANLTPTLLPGFPNLYGGKEDVRAWLADAMAVNLEIETEILSVAGDTVTTRSKVWSDYLQTLNAAPIVVNEVIKVRDGQVWSWNRTIPATSVNKLQEGLVELGIPATITPEPGEVLASTISDIVGVWTGAIAGGSEGPVEFESNGNYHMEGDSGRFWFNESFLWIKTEKEHYAGDSLHSCKKGLIGSYVVYVTRSGDQSVGLRYIPILDPCDLRYSFFEGEIHTPR